METFIVAAKRSAIGKAPRGKFRFMRPDDIAAAVIRDMLQSQLPALDRELIEDVIAGNAMPESEQGLNIGRLISLMALDTEKVPGMTVNRFCSSGLEAIAIAAAKIKAGLAHCIIAGGVENMSLVPIGGWRAVPNPEVAKHHPDWYWGMGLTAEEVAKVHNIDRQEQDQFAFHSHQKAAKAIDEGKFRSEITPIKVSESFLDNDGKRKINECTMDTDEGPRRDTSVEALAKLKPVFAQNGSVTAGNSSQTSDGAAFTVVMSEKMVKEQKISPIARFVAYAVAGVPPRIMGIGPVEAVPKVLKQAGMKQSEIDLIELNEAFASQSVTVIKKLELNPEIINVNGGAIALGHPLGCSGAKLTVQILNELRRRNKKYGLVTMCVGTGQGAAGVFEMMN